MVRSLTVMECGAFQTQVDLNMAQNYVDQYDDAEWDWGQGAALEGSRMMSRKLCGDMKDLLADNQGLKLIWKDYLRQAYLSLPR